MIQKTLKWLKSLSGRSLCLVLVLLVSTVTLSSCSPSSIAKGILSGGGANVAANTQVGAENVQGFKREIAPTATLRPNSRVGSLDQRVTTTNEVDTSVWIFIGLCFAIWSWFLYKLPSPDQIWKKKN